MNSQLSAARARRAPGPCGVSGFTLLELLIGLTLLALMMVMMYSALNLGIRAWDAGDARAGEAAEQRILHSFLRNEFSQVFAARWRDTADSRIAFEGARKEIRFVSALSLDAGQRDGGLQWAYLRLADDTDVPKVHGTKALVLSRQPFDMQARDWAALNAFGPEKQTRLLRGLQDVEIAYFGAENNEDTPRWRDEWASPQRLPQLIKFTFTAPPGRVIPALIIQLMLGEEAGCYESGFSRQCGPRRT